MKEYLIEKPFLPGKNGTTITLLQYLNNEIIPSNAFKVICKI